MPELPAPPPVAGEAEDKAAYEAVVAVGSCGALEGFANAWPGSFYATLARERASTACAAPPEQQQGAGDPQEPAGRGYVEGLIFPDSASAVSAPGIWRGFPPATSGSPATRSMPGTAASSATRRSPPISASSRGTSRIPGSRS